MYFRRLTGLVGNYSCVQGGFGAPGVGNIGENPLFADPYGSDGLPGGGDDDLRLLAGSPCIDAADNSAVPKGITTDLAGNPRFVDDLDTPDTGNGTPPIVDMGAYEFQCGCPADFDGDGLVGINDFLFLLAVWGTPDADIDGDDDTGINDFLLLLSQWGPCP